MDTNREVNSGAKTLKELSILYKVSTRTLKNWLKRHSGDIGERVGHTYTPDQVRKIFSKIGEP